MLRIKELRQKQNILQKDLAIALNIPANTFNQYETGKREPDYETLKRIANYFKVSTDYLLGQTENPTIINDSEVHPLTIEYGKLLKKLSPEMLDLEISHLRSLVEIQEKKNK